MTEQEIIKELHPDSIVKYREIRWTKNLKVPMLKQNCVKT